MIWLRRSVIGAGFLLVGLLFLPGGVSGSVTGAPATGPLVALSQQTGRVVGTAPRFAPAGAQVSVIAADGRGGWWIGGTFGQVGGFRCPYLVHLLPDLKIDQRWCPHANNAVLSVVAAGSTLFIGGYFTRVGQVRRKYLAAIDARSRRVLPWDPRPNNGVSSMGLRGTSLYLVGAFDHLGGKPRYTIGAVDVRSGNTTAWNPRPDTNEHGDSVNWLAVDGHLVFVSGLFSHIGGAARDGFAALDANTGKPASFRVAGGINPIVGKERLYVGLRQGGTLVYDLPSLRRESRWASRLGNVFSADSRFAYSSVAYSSNSFSCPCDESDRERVLGLDPATGATRWRSPLFSDPYNPYGGSSRVAVSFAVASSPSYVLVGGNFQHVR